MKKTHVLMVLLAFLTSGKAWAGGDKVTITWTTMGATVKGAKLDSLKISTDGGRVVIKDKYQARDIDFVLSGRSDNGSLVYKGKHKTTFELKNLTLTSSDSIPLNFKNSKKTVLKLTGDNRLTVSADTLDGALVRTKGKLHIKGKGSLTMQSASVGCKGLKVGKDLVMDDGHVSIQTSGMYVEVDTTNHWNGPMGPPPGMFAEGDSTHRMGGPMGPPPGMFPQDGNFPTDSLHHGMPHADFPGGRLHPGMGDGNFPPMNGGGGFPPMNGGNFPPMPEGGFQMPEGGFPGGEGFAPPMKQKCNGSSKAVRVSGTITINGGSLTIHTDAPAAEGLEGKQGVTINGGTVTVDAYDDAINSGGKIVFAGGTVRATSRGNDAVDSNAQGDGAITLAGGDVEAVSLVGSPEEGLDCDFNAILVTGGRVLGIGGAMGPSPSTPNNQTAQQLTVVLNGLDLKQGSVVSILDANGKSVFQYTSTAAQRDSHLLITCPAFQSSGQYTVTVDGASVTTFDFVHGNFASLRINNNDSHQ